MNISVLCHTAIRLGRDLVLRGWGIMMMIPTVPRDTHLQNLTESYFEAQDRHKPLR
jgi:hypothetical protein